MCTSQQGINVHGVGVQRITIEASETGYRGAGIMTGEGIGVGITIETEVLSMIENVTSEWPAYQICNEGVHQTL